MADDASLDDVRLSGPYFEQPEPARWEGDGSGDYADPKATFENTVTYEYSHSLGEIVSALIDAGLRIEFLHEHTECAWQRLPSMVKGDDGFYRLAGNDGLVPFMFSIRAHKPA